MRGGRERDKRVEGRERWRGGKERDRRVKGNRKLIVVLFVYTGYIEIYKCEIQLWTLEGEHTTLLFSSYRPDSCWSEHNRIECS